MTCNNENKSLSLRKDQRGLSTVEYALLFVLIVAATATLWSSLGDAIVAALTTSSATYIDAIK